MAWDFRLRPNVLFRAPTSVGSIARMENTFEIAESIWNRWPRAGFIVLRLWFLASAMKFSWQGTRYREDVAWALASARDLDAQTTQ